MPRGSTFAQVVILTRLECRDTLSAAQQVDWVPTIKYHVAAAQYALWLNHDWPFLRVKYRIILNGGTRFYQLPTPMSLEGLSEVFLLYQDQRYKLDYGIEPEHYTEFDSEGGALSSPVRRWEITIPTGDGNLDERIEVWPVPDIGGMDLWLKGMRPPRDLLDDGDIVDLDDILVAKYAAIDLLGARKAPDIQTKIQEAQAYLAALQNRVIHTQDRPFSMLGSGSRSRSPLMPGTLYASRS